MRVVLIASSIAVILTGGFLFVPAAPVATHFQKPEEEVIPVSGGWHAQAMARRGGPKSGLRIAVEGRLKWLGLAD